MAVGMVLKGRKVAVVGANASSIALIKFLLKKGATAKLIDNRAQAEVEPMLSESLDLTKFALECGELTPQTLQDVNVLITTTATKVDPRLLEAARVANIEIVSELEFVSQFIEEPVIAIAGTNGKSTTAALAAALLENSGKTVFLNMGQPLAHYLNQSKAVDVVIAVTNSFSLEGVKTFKPQAIVMTNISEDHLNRYPNMETYVGAYREVLKNADANTVLVLNGQDPQVLAMVPQSGPQTRVFSNTVVPEGIESSWYNKTHLFVRTKEEGEPWSFSLTPFRLRGSHNRENLSAAILATLPFGTKKEAIEKVIQTFSALPSRVEFTKRLNSVALYNDACAANVNAVLRTLQAFTEPVILISGGRDKNQDYSSLIPHIRQRVKNLILVGEAKEKMNRAIGDYTETFLVGTLEEAIILAYQKSRSGDVILFSPGCDPTDVFPNHLEKGEFFKRNVALISAPRRPNVF